MMSEYIEVRGTENAYDSGLWFGRSMKTISTDKGSTFSQRSE